MGPARDLLALADDRPAEVVAAGPALAEEALAAGEPAPAAVALQAAGVAERRLMQDLPRSVALLERALELARGTGQPALAGQVLLSLAGSRAIAGQATEALADIDRAVALLDGADRGRALMQRATALLKAGEQAAALATYDAALAQLDAAGDEVWAAHARANRGLVHTYRGAVDAAVADLEAAGDAYRRLGLTYQRAVTVHNLGFALGRAGDLPAALRRFDEAAAGFVQLGVPLAELPLDRAEVLLAAGLAAEAAAIAREAAAELEAGGMEADGAEALLIEAQAALAAGDVAVAVAAAERAGALFAGQGRPAWAALADHVAIDARQRRGDDPAGLIDGATEVAGRLAEVGHATAAASAELIAGRLALAGGDVARARGHLERVRPAGRAVPAALRIQAALARSLLHQATGERARALAAARAGLRAGEQARHALGASDLRSGTGLHLAELAGHGLGLAIEGARPGEVLWWMDQVRGHAAEVRPVRPGVEGLAELRTVHGQLRTADPVEAPALVRRLVRLEREVQRRDRSQPAVGGRRAGTPPAVRPGELRERLGPDRALVALAEHGGRLLAVVAGAGRRARLVPLGPAAALAAAAAAQRRAIGWILDQEQPADRWLDRLDRATRQLDEGLARPLALDVPEVVLVPPTRYFHLGWSLLPSLAGRAVTIAPSVRRWAEPAARRPGGAAPGRVAAVAGPGLALAAAEVDAVAVAHGSAGGPVGRLGPKPGSREVVVQRGVAATVEAVLAAARGAAVLHLAAHGHLPAGNGMFAGVDLADGRLMVYDIERLDPAPDLVVLSACDSASVDHRPGEEFLGLAAGFLAAGTRTLVAATGAVPDSPLVVDLMARFHRQLAAGAAPARALAEARAAVGAGGGRPAAVAASFICFGADVSGEGPR